MKNKKGISPLIATVLLIGFTVALAAVVMTWGGGFVKKTTEQTGTTAEQSITCNNLNLKIVGSKCPYYSATYGIVVGPLTLQNTQNIKIAGVTVNAYNSKGLLEKSSTINPAGCLISTSNPVIIDTAVPPTYCINNYGSAYIRAVIPNPSSSTNPITKIEVISKLMDGTTCSSAPAEKAVNCPQVIPPTP